MSIDKDWTQPGSKEQDCRENLHPKRKPEDAHLTFVLFDHIVRKHILERTKHNRKNHCNRAEPKRIPWAIANGEMILFLSTTHIQAMAAHTRYISIWRGAHNISVFLS